MIAMAAGTEPPASESAEAEFPEPVDELRRYTPEEVSAKRWLPWTPRMIREKCYRLEIPHHVDGGQITLTADDIRAHNAASARTPVKKRARRKATA